MAGTVNTTKEQVELTLIDRMSAGVRSAAASVTELRSGLDSLKGVLAAVGVAFGAGAFVKFAKDAIDTADSLNKLSQRVGVSVEQLSALRYAGSLADVSMEDLSTSLRQLSRGMADMQAGTGEARDAFRAMGISATDSTGHLRSASDVLGDVAEAFAGMNDGATKTAFAMKIFGRSGSELIPLLNQGRSGLKAMSDEAEAMGLIISKNTAEAAEKFNDDLTKLNQTLHALGLSISKDALPWLINITEQMNAAAKATGGFFEGLNHWFAISGSQAKDPLAALSEIDKRLRTLQADRAVLAGDSIGAKFNRIMAPEDLAMLDKQIAYAKTQQAILTELLKSRVSGNAAGLVEDAAGNVGPRGKTNGPALQSQEDINKAIAERKKLLDQDAAGWVKVAEEMQKEFDSLVYTTDEFGNSITVTTEEFKKLEDVAKNKADFAFQKQIEDAQRLAQERIRLDEYVDGEKLKAIQEAEQAEKDANWRSFQTQIDQVRKIQDEYKKNSEILAQSITDGIMRGFERGTPFWENFKNSIRNAVLTITIQPVVLGVSNAIAAPISGALTGAGQAVGSSLFGDAAGLGGLFSSGAAAGGGLAEEAAALGISDLGAAGIGGGFMSTVGAALPWVGAGLLAASALGLFDGDGPAQRSAEVGGGLGGAFIQNTHWWSDREMSGAVNAFFSAQQMGEQNLARNLNLTPAQLAAVNAALGGISGRTYAAGQEHTPVEQSGFFQQISADRLQAISQALGRSIEDLTKIMSLSADQWQQAIDQMEQAQRQAEQSLAQFVQSLPQTLGITSLTAFQNELSTSDTLAPTDRLAAARSIYEDTLSRALGGDLTAVQAFPGAAQSLLGIGRDAFASGAGYQDLFREVNLALNEVLDKQRQLQSDILKDVPTTIMETSASQIAALKDQTAQLVSALASIRTELQKMQAA